MVSDWRRLALTTLGSAVVLLLLGFAEVQAGAVEAANVGYQEGRYSLDLVMRIDSQPEAVYALVTDYDGLERISDAIIESELLDATDQEHKRRRLVTRVCILFFCFTSTLVENVVDDSHGRILTTIVPALSDYRYGESIWHISAAGPGTRIHFQTTLEPDFWIPPVIGPWLMKQKMRSEAEHTILNIEQLTHDV